MQAESSVTLGLACCRNGSRKCLSQLQIKITLKPSIAMPLTPNPTPLLHYSHGTTGARIGTATETTGMGMGWAGRRAAFGNRDLCPLAAR